LSRFSWVLMCFLRYCILFIWQDSGFSTNHPFFRMFSTWYFSLSSTDVSMIWSGMNWLQHWSMNTWNTECICIFLSKSSS
jgi:hypothetical protein